MLLEIKKTKQYVFRFVTHVLKDKQTTTIDITFFPYILKLLYQRGKNAKLLQFKSV